MKPIYNSLVLTAMTLSVSLSLKAQVNDGESVTESAVLASSLDGLKVELVSPNVTGARDLIASGECVIDGADLNISLNTGDWLKGATYSVRVSAVFGTQTVVLYVLNVEVPRYEALANETQEYEDTVTVVSTYGDGDKSGADATVYAKDGDGNAHITKPLSIGDGVASGNGAIASGYVGEGASIQSDGAGAIASGDANGEGASIQASDNGAIASGDANGEGASIQANDIGAIANGYANGEGASIQANGAGAVARGNANGDGASIQASDNGAIASGFTNGEGASIYASGTGTIANGYANGDGASIQADYNGSIACGYADADYGNVEATGQASQAFGIGVQTTKDAQMVVGKCNVVDEDDSYQFIVGNGTDDEHRSNAFAVTKSGELALFKSDGTPVILTPALLEAIIALV